MIIPARGNSSAFADRASERSPEFHRKFRSQLDVGQSGDAPLFEYGTRPFCAPYQAHGNMRPGFNDFIGPNLDMWLQRCALSDSTPVAYDNPFMASDKILDNRMLAYKGSSYFGALAHE